MGFAASPPSLQGSVDSRPNEKGGSAMLSPL